MPRFNMSVPRLQYQHITVAIQTHQGCETSVSLVQYQHVTIAIQAQQGCRKSVRRRQYQHVTVSIHACQACKTAVSRLQYQHAKAVAWQRPSMLPSLSKHCKCRYYKAAKLAEVLQRDEHYTVDEKQKSVLMTEDGYEAAEDVLEVCCLLFRILGLHATQDFRAACCSGC